MLTGKENKDNILADRVEDQIRTEEQKIIWGRAWKLTQWALKHDKTKLKSGAEAVQNQLKSTPWSSITQ